MLKAFPQHGYAWFAIVLPALKPAQLGNPAHRLPQGGRCGRRDRHPMDATLQPLPLLFVQQHRAGHIRRGARQHGGVDDAPGNHAVERQAAFQPISGFQLAALDPAATFQDFMPDLNGIVASDKFCMTRMRTLDLSWRRGAPSTRVGR